MNAVRFSWYRWFGAVMTVSVFGVVLRRIAAHVGPSDGSTWWSLLRTDLEGLVVGEISSEAVVRASVVVMTTALAWIVVSLVVVVVSFRRAIILPRSMGRMATFFVCGGAMMTSSILSTSPVSAMSTSLIVSEDRPAETNPIVIGGASDVQLVATALMSGLVGAGLAVRLRARDHVRRRSETAATSNDTEIFPPLGEIGEDLLGEICRAERALDDIVGVVARIRHLAPADEIRHVIDERSGWYVVEFTHPVKVVPGTQLLTQKSVRLHVDSSDDPSISTDRAVLPPLLHVGRVMSGELWVSLDAYADFGVDCASDEGQRVWNHLCESLVLGPTCEDRGLVSDIALESRGPRRIFHVGAGTSVAEGVGRVGESIAVIGDDQESCRVPTLRRVTTGEVTSGLSRSRGEWRLLPVDIPIRPVGAGDDDIRRIRELLGDPVPVIEIRDVGTSTSKVSSVSNGDVTGPDMGWTFMACVLGPPRVVDRRFDAVEFERGKAEELVIWLAFHPQQRKRSLARTALWLSPVQDATFSNITAAARRSLNAVVRPPEGDNWVGITLSDDLPLANGFTTDVDVLRKAVDLARRHPEDHGCERLREALQLVRGVPFAGSTYTWSDSIGMSGEAATLVVRAATMMAEMCQEIGDMGGVYWATAKGLLALPGHEELVATRLRAHAEHGDRMAMRAEWESYRRAVASEWGDAEPSEKMMDLWRRLGVG